MRKEASLEQWKELYEVATRIKELKPWEKFWDMDLIGVRNGAEEDTVFYSILVLHVLKDNSRTHNNLSIQPAYL